MQEFCAADGICTQQAYDGFGRARGQTQWHYHAWGSMGQNANIIVTRGLPRCEGNFVRKLYDGIGRLIQEQAPRQGWETTQHGFSTVDNQLETVVDYGCDGLGRLLRTGVPRPVVIDWVHGTDWDQGYIATSYDGLSRPAGARAQRRHNDLPLQRPYLLGHRFRRRRGRAAHAQLAAAGLARPPHPHSQLRARGRRMDARVGNLARL